MDVEIPESSRQFIKDMLKSYDKDGNGVIDVNELEGCLISVGFCPSPDDVEFLHKHFDKNGDGVISIDKIIDNLAVINMHSIQGDELVKAFKIFDLNKDGYIGQHELIKIFTVKGPFQMTYEEAVAFTQDLLRKYDKDFDKKFDYSEFVRMFAEDAIELPKGD